MSLRDKWRHAFAVDEPGPAEPTPEQQPVVDRVCREVARRHLATPSLIGLELSRPMNYLASQFMHAVSPLVWAIARRDTHDNYEHFATFLEKRGAVDYLCERVEHFEREYERQEQERRGKPAPQRDDADKHGGQEESP